MDRILDILATIPCNKKYDFVILERNYGLTREFMWNRPSILAIFYTNIPFSS